MGLWDRLFGFKVGEDRVRYGALCELELREQQAYLARAIAARQSKASRRCFDAMLDGSNQAVVTCVKALPNCLPRNDDAATTALTYILPAIPEPRQLLGQNLDIRLVYLIGSAFLGMANAAQGSSQSRLEDNRDTAMAFLDEARQRAERESQQPAASGEPYRQAATPSAYTAEKMTASYEEAMYLAFIPAVASYSSSYSGGDGG